MTTIILETIKTSIGIFPDNLGFDLELLLFISSAKSQLVQLGVAELDMDIDEQTEWPTFGNATIESLAKHYLVMKVKQSFDPSASETISNTLSETLVELGGRISHEAEELVV